MIPRKEVVNEMGHSGLWGKKRGVLQIKNGWKLLRNPQKLGINPIGDHFELYNVIDDPSETKDVKNDFPKIFEDMKAQVERLLEDMVPEDNPLDPTAHNTDGHGNLSTDWC